MKTKDQMTVDERLRKFEEICRKDGLKITHQRFEIFRELLRSTDHPTVEKLHSRLAARLPTISLDTVYRTLATLEQHGLVTRVETVESQVRFEGKLAEHHHAICKKCGRITDFQWQVFDQAPLPGELEAWGRIDRKSITLRGLCRQCARQDPAE